VSEPETSEPPGSRQRLGLLIPSSNSVMEVDFYRNLPAGVTLHTARMYMEDTTPEGESLMLDRFALPAARDVGTARPDAVVFGCTSAGALRGNDYDHELCDRIAEAAGCPAVSVIASVRGAIERRRGRRIGVVTPYVDSLNQKIKESIEAGGDVEVAGIFGLGITENFTIAEVSPDEVVRFAVSSLGPLSIDLAFASCTNFRAMEVVPELEQALGVPVVTSNAAAFEATAELLRGSGRVSGAV
jgi:maleate isomerase